MDDGTASTDFRSESFFLVKWTSVSRWTSAHAGWFFQWSVVKIAKREAALEGVLRTEG